MTKNAVTPVAEGDELDAEATETEEILFSAKDLATEAGTDAKSFRRWLRDHTGSRANDNGRWRFTADAKAALLDAYNKRNEPEADDADAAPAESE